MFKKNVAQDVFLKKNFKGKTLQIHTETGKKSQKVIF